MFFTSAQEFPYRTGDIVDIAATLDINEYGGNRSVSVIIKDIKSNSDDTGRILESGRIFEDFCRGTVQNKDKLAQILPQRSDFAEVYRFIRSVREYNHKPEHMVHIFNNRIPYGKIKVILYALRELGLIGYTEGLKQSRVCLRNTGGRVDLESARIIRKIREELQ